MGSCAGPFADAARLYLQSRHIQKRGAGHSIALGGSDLAILKYKRPDSQFCRVPPPEKGALAQRGQSRSKCVGDEILEN